MSLPFAYNPPTGVNDTTQFPDSDPNLRVHLQALLDQIKDCLNNDVNSSLAAKANVIYENPIAPTLLNLWVNNGGAYATVKYWKDSLGYVNGMGVAKSGVIGQAAYTLPVGYRPAASIQPVGSSNGGAGVIIIDASGNVVPAAGSNTSFDLTFRFKAGV